MEVDGTSYCRASPNVICISKYRQRVERLLSLIYIVSITDECSQYDIEPTENNKQCKKCKLLLAPALEVAIVRSCMVSL